MGSRKEQWERDGYVLVEGLFSREEVERYRDHFMEWNDSDRKEDFDKVDPTGQDPLARFPRIIHPHRKDPLSLDFMLDSRLRDIMTGFLGEEPLAAQTMFYFKPPMARGQALHQDQMYLQARPGTCIAAWLAVDDCDEENGCMEIVPGSQDLPLLCHIDADTSRSFSSKTVPVPEGYKAIPAIMKAGDVLFFHGNLIHGSGPNTSQTRFRRALIGHYITADAVEAAHFYHPLLRFDGTAADLEDAPDGGSCGAVTEDGIEMVEIEKFEIKAPH
ncbi:MAG: phytanoyl-CoA dioxygenase family protein [Fimbriimonadales bacterium]